MKRNAFGQLILSPHIRSFNDDAGAGGGGGGGDGKSFTPPSSQEELDKLINGAVARTHKQYEPLKEKASKWDAHEANSKNDEPKPKPNPGNEDKPTGVTETDVDKRIQEALAAKDKELAVERVSDRLDKALEGRAFSASKLFSLDRSQFVKEDGKTVDDAAIKDWVEKNSTETAAPSRRLRGQGERSAGTSGGSVSAGRDLYDEIHKKKSGKD